VSTRRYEAVTKLIVQTRLIAVATSDLPVNFFGTRTLCRLDERITLCATIDMHQGQERAEGRMIGRPVKLPRIGPYAPTGLSAIRR
jgi:hypothetical protein